MNNQQVYRSEILKVGPLWREGSLDIIKAFSLGRHIAKNLETPEKFVQISSAFSTPSFFIIHLQCLSQSYESKMRLALPITCGPTKQCDFNNYGA